VTAGKAPSGSTTGRATARWSAMAGTPAAGLPVKLRPPRARVRTVERRALLEALAAAPEPLVLMCAPAGTGKTTALRQWTEADGRLTAWVQLDPSDDDAVVLLIYLARALGAVAPVGPDVEESLGLAVPPVRERVLPMLADAMSEAPPFVLVLDDAHLLQSAKCWDVVAFVLRSLPPGAQLALGTRTDPPLPLARLRASGELAEFRAQQLALDPAETAELVRLHGCEADEAAVDALLSVTEGWATGLHLACLAAGGRPLEEWLPRVRGERREIAAYLTSEVLDGQPADVQDFLLKTSVLTELTPALCKLITGRDDAGELLALTARQELFVIPLGDDGHHYRYHHLFAEMLEAELEARHPGERDELHRRAAGWYAGHDDPDAEVRHLLAAGEIAAAGDVVAAAWPGLWSRGQAETVRRWLESFDDRQVLGHKALTLTAGWVYTALDDGKLGERWCKAACGAPMDDAPSPDGAASLRSSQALLRATVAPDGVRRMREDAELAASLETTPGTSWYADAQVSLGVARWLSGSVQRALHPLAVAAREGSVYNPSVELAALGYLALISADETAWETAQEYEARDGSPDRAGVRHQPALSAHAAGAGQAAGARAGRGRRGGCGGRGPSAGPHGPSSLDGSADSRRAGRGGGRTLRQGRGRGTRLGGRGPARALPRRGHPAASRRAPARRRRAGPRGRSADPRRTPRAETAAYAPHGVADGGTALRIAQYGQVAPQECVPQARSRLTGGGRAACPRHRAAACGLRPGGARVSPSGTT